MFSTFSRLFHKRPVAVSRGTNSETRKRAAGRARPSVALEIENLEDRVTPSVVAGADIIAQVNPPPNHLVSAMTTTNTNFIVTPIAIEANSIQISWPQPSNMSLVSSYNVKLAGPGFGNHFENVATVNGNTHSAAIASLLPNTEYRIEVEAVGSAGNTTTSAVLDVVTARPGRVASSVPAGVNPGTANAVIGVYQEFLARTPSAQEVYPWAHAILNRTASLAQVVSAIENSV